MTTVFPDDEPGLVASVLWAWLGAVFVGFFAESLGAVIGGRLDLGASGALAVLVAPAVFPGLAGALSAALLFWHPKVRGFGRAAAVVVGMGVGAVVVGTTAWLLPTSPFPAPGWPLLAPAGIVATAVSVALLGRARAVAVGISALPAVVAGAVGLGPMPTRSSGTPGPTVVVVTVDALRADRVGGHRIDTAAFDRVAAEGARFDLAFSPTPRSGPAAASVLTGEMPWTHGAWRSGDAPTGAILTEQLAAGGYATAAFVSRAPLHRDSGLDRGFVVYDDDFAWVKGTRELALGRALLPAFGRRFERRAAGTVDRAVRWLRRHPTEAAFVWVHLGDPHGPYDPPPPFDERYYQGTDRRDPGRRLPAGLPGYHGSSLDGITDPEYVVARYDGEVAYTDLQLTRLLTALDDRPGDEVVVVVGLYGELLGEHDAWFRHDELYEAALHVPLAIRAPGLAEPGTVIRQPVEIRDIAPTLVELAVGAQQPRSLVPALRHGSSASTTARSVRPGSASERPAVSIRGERVRYLFLAGDTPVERAWTLSGTGGHEELPLTGDRRDTLRSEARALLEQVPTR